MDGSENLYRNVDNAVTRVNLASPPNIRFAQTNVGSTSSGGGPMIAMLTSGPGGVPHIVMVPKESSLGTQNYGNVWVDTVHRTLVLGLVFLETDSNGNLTCNSYPQNNVVAKPGPLLGTLNVTTDNLYLPGGLCPGKPFPFQDVHYTWGSKTSADRDPFVLRFTTQNGTYENDFAVAAELAHLKNSHAVWNVCGDPNSTLPTTATLSLDNPPPNATSFEWTIAAPQEKMSFLNGQSTITTTTPSTTIQGLDASGTRNDISLTVVAREVPFSGGLTYGPLRTWVRRPSELRLQNGHTMEFGPINNGETLGLDSCFIDGADYPCTAYQTSVYWQIDDQFGDNTYDTNQANVGVSEQVSDMTTPSDSSYLNNNWHFDQNRINSGWSTLGGQFVDYLAYAYLTGATPIADPMPQMPPPINGYYQTQLVTTASQVFFTGDSIPGDFVDPAPYQGCKIQNDTINFGIDHANENPVTQLLDPPTDNVIHQNTSTIGAYSEGPFSQIQQGGIGGSSILAAVPDFGLLAQESTDIVVGRVLNIKTMRARIQDSSKHVNYNAQATVELKRTLKGKFTAGALTVIYPIYSGPLRDVLVSGKLFLLFLRRVEGDTFELSNPLGGAMETTPSDVLIPRVGQGSSASVEAILLRSLTYPDRKTKLTALVQIGNIRHGEPDGKDSLDSTTMDVLKEAAASSDQEAKGLAYISLIKRGDYSLLDQAVEFAQKKPQYSSGATEYPTVFSAEGIINAVRAIGENYLRKAIEVTGDQDLACASRANIPFDKSALQILNSLVDARSVNVRRAAVHALRGICDTASAPVLAHALRDSDPQVQYDALQGLAALEDFPLDRPAMANYIFEQNPAEYVRSWESWWTSSGKLKYGAHQ